MIYIITLERSKQRAEPLMAQLNEFGLSYELIYGVDGHKLSDEECRQHFPDESFFQKKYGRSPMKTEIACALSHLEACRRLLDSGAETAIIMEDDAFFQSSPKRIFEFFSRRVCGNQLHLFGYPARAPFDLKWGGWSEPIRKEDTVSIDRAYEVGRSIEEKNFGLLCYCISKGAAKRLRDSLPIVSVIDDYEVLNKKVGLDVLHMRPYVCIERPEATSSITGNKRNFVGDISFRKKISRILKGLRLRVYSLP